MHGNIKFNQIVWLKPYISMTTELKKNAKNYLEKYFFKLFNNAVLNKKKKKKRKKGNVIKHRDIKVLKAASKKIISHKNKKTHEE